MHDRHDALVIILLFTAAALAVVASSDAVPSLVRLTAAAIAAGAGAVLAVLSPTGSRGGSG